jgi:hypothetical protein
MRNRRKGSGKRVTYRVVKGEKSFRIRATVREKTVVVQLIGEWSWFLRNTLTETAEVIFGVDPVDIVMSGRGGGRGFRQQKTGLVRIEIPREAWVDGMDELMGEWTVLEE